MMILNGLEWETWFIIQFQKSPYWISHVMEVFTWLGYPQAYMLVIAVVYWAFDRKLGLRMAVFLPLCAVVNSLLKQAFHAPRPYWTDLRITGMHADTGFGMPSGHAQSSTVWLLAAFYLGKKWFWITAIFISMMVGVSRTYLGVHFPLQILSGWTAGIIILLVYVRLEKGVISWISRTRLSAQILTLVLSTAGMILLGFVLVKLLDSWAMPEAWNWNTGKYLSLSKTGLQAYGMASVSGNAASFLGVALGALLLNARGNFSSDGSIVQRILRILIGIIILASIFIAMQFLEPAEEAMFSYSAWRFSGFFIISFTAVYLMPLLFLRAGLLQRE